jgi:hypothetical protein
MWKWKKTQKEPVKHRDAIAWGSLIILIGVLLILGMMLIEVTVKPERHEFIIHIGLVEHLVVSDIVLGCVGIMADFHHWQKYFQERLAETIIGRNYLKTLSKPQLISLQTDTLRAFFQVDEIDREESLLGYFLTKIQGYIASPYRLDTSGIATVRLSEDKRTFLVEETISYKCRKVGGSIQNEVSWVYSKDLIKNIEEFHIQLEIPEGLYQAPDFQARHPAISGIQTTYDMKVKDGSKLIPDANGAGFTLPLDDYRDIDGLYVEVHVKYVVGCGWPFTWGMSHPSKNLTLTVNYPEDFDLEMNAFGIQDDEYHEEKRKGLYVLRYDSWLLPSMGLYYHLSKRSGLEG